MRTSVRTLTDPVLVVEDDQDMRRFLVEVLTSAGFRAVTAENGLDALEQLRRHRPCVVLLDLALPLLDGSEFVRVSRADPEFPTVPIICISGMPDARERARRLGVAECLTKPVAMEVLIDSVIRHCGLV